MVGVLLALVYLYVRRPSLFTRGLGSTIPLCGSPTVFERVSPISFGALRMNDLKLSHLFIKMQWNLKVTPPAEHFGAQMCPRTTYIGVIHAANEQSSISTFILQNGDSFPSEKWSQPISGIGSQLQIHAAIVSDIPK